MASRFALHETNRLTRQRFPKLHMTGSGNSPSSLPPIRPWANAGEDQNWQPADLDLQHEYDSFDPPSIAESLTPNRNSLVGALTSTVLHMVLLICLGVLFASVQQEGNVEIRMALANTNSEEQLETFTVENEQSPDAPDVTTHDVAPPAEMAVAEPALVMELGELAVGSDLADPTARLSDSIETPGAGANSGQKSDKKGSFFGAEAYGDRFVYVVDMSTSMGYASSYGQTRFRVACRELLRSINALKKDQEFCVFMFSYRTRTLFDAMPRMIRATKTNKDKVANWVSSLRLGGGTDPRYGTMMALKLKPDAIFLLSDGEFNGREMNTHGIPSNPTIEKIISKMRTGKVPIHTIAFEDMLNRKRLRRIASHTDGTHRFIGNVSNQTLLVDDLSSKNVSDVAYGMQGLIDGKYGAHDDRHLNRAAQLIAQRFKSRDAKLRQLAYQAMLKLADGDDVGPGKDNPTAEDYVEAQKAWFQYWRDHFRRKRLGEKEDEDEMSDDFVIDLPREELTDSTVRYVSSSSPSK